MINTACAVALGFFDGVHIAHQKIIQTAVDYAKQ
ncbi:MAG: bifunctional riboflavin kinase/FAD synthetase, partial [Clostridia bacterium]|nr:bifunctional riboflavin kinase/FAD synthetase [Clostridia bacterium]